MADYRQIHVSIWNDEWFLDLEPDQKLLFIYLFSNKNASMSGLYKLPIKVMAFETGLDQKNITKSLDLFAKANKVHYQDGIVWVVNMRRYHETKSATVQTHMTKELALIPDCELKRAYMASLDTLSIPYQYPNAINLKKLKEDKLNAEDQAGSMILLAERLIGLPVNPTDLPTIDAWEREGVTEDDIRGALQWRTDNKHPPVKTISQLANGVKTSRLQRLQIQNGRKTEPIPYDPAAHATEVYN